MDFALGRVGVHLTANVLLNVIRAGLILDGDDSKVSFEQLHDMKEQVEESLGSTLVWRNSENVRMCSIFAERNADLSNRNDWPDQFAWLREHIERFDEYFRPIVQQLGQR